jgi:hypothetical protein
MVRVREFAGVSAIAFLAMGAAIGFQSLRPSFQPSAVAVAPSVAHVSVPRVVGPPAQTSRLAFSPGTVETPRKANLVVAQAGVGDEDERAQAVATRLRDYVPRELFRYFNVFLYVSKAAEGSWAQRMFIFHRDEYGDLEFEQAIPVSTGRERYEKYFTTTPTGLFELDPNRFDRIHFSRRWHHAPMPWAMFLNYTIHGHLAGIALHSAIGHEADLGRRASGGCIRLPPEMARYLFQRFQREEFGLVPVFAFDGDRNSTNVVGRMVRDADGRPVLEPGYRVLLLVQNYPGGPPLVAVVS